MEINLKCGDHPNLGKPGDQLEVRRSLEPGDHPNLEINLKCGDQLNLEITQTWRSIESAEISAEINLSSLGGVRAKCGDQCGDQYFSEKAYDRW